MLSTKQSAPVGQSSNSQYFRCLGKRLFPEDRSGGLAGLGPSESKLKRSLPVRRICSSSFLCRFMSERTLSRRASRFWLRAELPGVRLLSISESLGVTGSSSKSNSVGMCGLKQGGQKAKGERSSPKHLLAYPSPLPLPFLLSPPSSFSVQERSPVNNV